MIKRQQASDKIAGSLSLACALHCLFMPSFLIVTSGFLSVSIDNELIHLVILLGRIASEHLCFGSRIKKS